MHKLPALGYSYDSLEPYIDAKTMEIHYSKHHQTYVDKFNAALEKHPELQKKDVKELLENLHLVPEDIRTAVRNHGGGHFNHSFFWTVLAKEVKCSGKILKEIEKEFGSYDKFVEEFKNSAVSHFGSGWAWLVFNPKTKKIEIMQTHDQESPVSVGKVPLLVIDVWEHAYYLKHQNKRADWATAFMNVINWKKVEENFLEAKA